MAYTHGTDLVRDVSDPSIRGICGWLMIALIVAAKAGYVTKIFDLYAFIQETGATCTQ